MNNFFNLSSALLFSALSTVVHAQTEEQRKYIFPKMNDEAKALVEKGSNVEGLSVKKHSIYDYMDIYVDSKDFDLYHNNFSLRFRRRIFEDGRQEYGMQIKSEMINNGDARMEVEEDELNIYNVVYNGEVLKLQTVVDELFDRYLTLAKAENADFSNDPAVLRLSDIVRVWLNFKMDAAVAPLQKLKHVKKQFKSIDTLRPVMIGRSIRTRSRVFIDRKDTAEELISFKQSSRNSSDVPSDLSGDRYIWTMEASFDQAIFYSVINNVPPHQIYEFEVENKYLPHEGARPLVDRLENGLLKTYKAEINLDSKYRQSAKVFYRLP